MKATLILMMLMASSFAIGQRGNQERIVDLRTQVKPRADEQRDAMMNVKIADQVSWQGYLPNTLGITVRSVSPIVGYISVVEVAFQNTGKEVVRLPVSLERKLLHEPGSTDRRSLGCFVTLWRSPEEGTLGPSFSTVMSPNDRNSFVELAPNETVVLRFDAIFQTVFDGAAVWLNHIKAGTVDAGVECLHEVLEPYGNVARQYMRRTSELFKSTNRVRLSMP